MTKLDKIVVGTVAMLMLALVIFEGVTGGKEALNVMCFPNCIIAFLLTFGGLWLADKWESRRGR